MPSCDNLPEANFTRRGVTRLFLFFLMVSPMPALADGYGFMTPSGNIYCNGAVEYSSISCTIVERSGALASPRPRSCTATWGHEFNLDATGQASLSCGNPPQRVDYSDIAGYGQTADFGDITCRSDESGLTCRNLSGHGFTLSRRHQSLF